ncbi:hypothetical protein OROMI_005245 [Orobanche minor]
MAARLAAIMIMNLIGDVKGKVAVMVDDMIDTAEVLGSTQSYAKQPIDKILELWTGFFMDTCP